MSQVKKSKTTVNEDSQLSLFWGNYFLFYFVLTAILILFLGNILLFFYKYGVNLDNTISKMLKNTSFFLSKLNIFFKFFSADKESIATIISNSFN